MSITIITIFTGAIAGQKYRMRSLVNNTGIYPTVATLSQMRGNSWVDLQSLEINSSKEVVFDATASGNGNFRLMFNKPVNSASNDAFELSYIVTERVDKLVSSRVVKICNTDEDFTEDYRYGFNGQEKVDEVKGTGNSLDYKYRMADTRLGRFFAVDPIAKNYPELTVYQMSSLNQIWMIELEGLEGDKSWQDQNGVSHTSESTNIPNEEPSTLKKNKFNPVNIGNNKSFTGTVKFVKYVDLNVSTDGDIDISKEIKYKTPNQKSYQIADQTGSDVVSSTSSSDLPGITFLQDAFLPLQSKITIND
jgi:hypothetical protein